MRRDTVQGRAVGAVRCCAAAALLTAGTAVAQSLPWHLNGWAGRAVIRLTTPAAEKDVDTAAVRVLCQGMARSDGSDLRVVDAGGAAIPFQIAFINADHEALLLFRAADPTATYGVYFGNPGAARAPEAVVADPAPGSGPPRGAWIPRFGLVFATARRPPGPNPKTVDQLAALLAASPAAYGARLQRRIWDAVNPFGPSDYYLSTYRGWIRIPRPGKYGFCTISNEGSFSFLDGKPLVHWPGRHTEERGKNGEVHTELDLSAGLHYIEYYQEEVTLAQMSVLGWRPPEKAGGPFVGMPESVYTAAHGAEVVRYETPAGPLPRFEPRLTAALWPEDRNEGQYTRCEFRPAPGSVPDGAACTWDFGDGLTGAGASVAHVYLATGIYTVALTVAGVGGSVRWPLEVYEVQNETEQIRRGDAAAFAQVARAYDTGRLAALPLRELVHLLAEGRAWPEALRAGEAFVSRYGAANPAWLPEVRRRMAEAIAEVSPGNREAVIATYTAALEGDTVVSRRVDTLARLIRLTGVDRRHPEEALKLFDQAEEAIRAGRMDPDMRRAYRRAMIAAGDTRLWQGRRDDALNLYRKAEALRETFVPSVVRAGRTGAYPDAIREYLQQGDPSRALELVAHWEETFPVDILHGQTYCWRGRARLAQNQPAEAAGYLRLSVELARGAFFETHARWLLAEALEKAGQASEAQRELERLVATGAKDPLVTRAAEKLKARTEQGR